MPEDPPAEPKRTPSVAGCIDTNMALIYNRGRLRGCGPSRAAVSEQCPGRAPLFQGKAALRAQPVQGCSSGVLRLACDTVVENLAPRGEEKRRLIQVP